jgi:hypothetical protein
MPKSIPGWLDAPWNPDQTQNPDLAGNPQAWNSLIVNSERLPGLAVVSVPKHVLVKQHGRASGKTPGAPTVRGREPGTAAVALHLRNNAEWAEYVAIAPRLLPWITKTASKNPGAVQVYHPLLAVHGLRWVLIHDFGGGEGPKGGGPCIIRFSLEETQDPATIKVTQAKPKSTGLEAAPIIDIAGEAPRPPNLRDLTRKPAALAR